MDGDAVTDFGEARLLTEKRPIGKLPGATFESYFVSFDAFVAEVVPKILRLAASSGLSRPDSEDLAAEALARAYASWDRLKGLDHRQAWVLRTSANLLCDRKRRSKAREHRSAPLSLPGFEDTVVEREALVVALTRLSRRQREAIVLHHMAGMTVEQTALVMTVSPETVRKHLARALAAMRSQLRKGRPEEGHD